MMFRVPGIVRPQTTLKYLFLSTALLYASYCYIFDVSPASSNLPKYTGPYDVGTVDIEVPCKRRKIDDATFKDTGLPAFQLETLLFSLFYPADEETTARLPQHTWISKPLSLTAEGYARFANIDNFVFKKLLTFGLWACGGIVRIPAKVDVPLVITTDHFDLKGAVRIEKSARFPIVVFSHGFATSRTDYTQYCAELASRGYIVAAIEHRDGSSPGSLLMNEGSTRPVFPILKDQLQSNSPLDRQDLKRIQLAFRQAEVEETIRILQSINEGSGSKVFQSNPRGEGRTLNGWQGRLDMNQVIIAGHSYGATLALQTLKGAPSQSFPIKGAIILDPGKNSGRLNSDINVPTLVVHADSWSKKHSIFFGRPHFDAVKELVEGVIARGKPAWFMTSVGTSHMSVADAPLIQPLLLRWTTGATIDVRKGVNEYVKVSVDFLRFLQSGNKAGLLAEPVTHSEYNQDIRDPELRKAGAAKGIGRYWQIHVSPPAS